MKQLTITVLGLLMSVSAYAANCPDISGHWAGQCVSSNGVATPSRLEISQQACESVTTNGVTMPVGATVAVAAWKNGVYEEGTSYLWVSPQQGAFESSTFVRGFKNNVLVYQDAIYGTSQIINGTLIVNARSSLGQVSCTYSH